MLVKELDQSYTYTTLRTQVGLYITDSDIPGLISLINPENIDIVRKCDDRVLDDEQQTEIKTIETLYTDYEALKTALAAAVNIDDVLFYFTSTNANLASLSDTFEDIVLSYDSYTVADPSTYIETLDTERLAKTINEC